MLVSMYKFKAELIAIEMSEIHQKKMREQVEKCAMLNANRQPITENENHDLAKQNSSENVILSKDIGSKQMVSSIEHNINNNNNNLLYIMNSGKILIPQPLNNRLTQAESVHSECDKPNSISSSSSSSSDNNRTRPHLKKNLVCEFENNDSSPFDNVELQTIDDIKELNNVFQALNTTNSMKIKPENVNNDLPVQKNGDITQTSSQNNATIEQSSGTNTMMSMYPNVYSNVMHLQPKGATNVNGLNMSHVSSMYNCSPISMVHHTNPIGPYSLSQPVAGIYTNSQHPMNNVAISSSYGQTMNHHSVEQQKVIYSNHNAHFNVAYPTTLPINQMSSQFEMKRSSSEKKDIFNANYETAVINDSHTSIANPLRSTKSVSDLTDISKSSQCQRFSTDSHASISDRSQTPPTKSNDQTLRSKTISLTDPYQTLSTAERQFVDNLCQMGFKQDRVSRAVKHIDINDDKKIFEYLFALQLLEDQGYDCYESEIALHMNNYNKEQAETFLKALKQICEFGFDREAAIKALFKSNNNRDNAIEILLNSIK
ncbi:hypothetical protein RDWZM_004794 [Blomia tropicalis]|uniref:UBA domain-containing protein n=1 Tax=Blomia tropicalis TaxID=40697 RepID=A0A9Q0M6S5_BLOTA|nr:hypothetical protein RDWZM_004794 [Blomia tropicalis]